MEPFTDIKVREAFSLAFDRETYCAVVRNGDCTPTLSWIPAGLPGSIETDKYGFNAEAAVQALAESSYGGPEGLPPITLQLASGDELIRLFHVQTPVIHACAARGRSDISLPHVLVSFN